MKWLLVTIALASTACATKLNEQGKEVYTVDLTPLLPAPLQAAIAAAQIAEVKPCPRTVKKVRDHGWITVTTEFCE